MIKMSDVCISMAVMVAFAVSGFPWFTSEREEGLVAPVWVPSILCLGIYCKLLALKGRKCDCPANSPLRHILLRHGRAGSGADHNGIQEAVRAAAGRDHRRRTGNIIRQE